MAKSTSDIVVPVHSAHRLDEGRLLSYLQANVKGFLHPPAFFQLFQVIESFSVLFGRSISNFLWRKLLNTRRAISPWLVNLRV